MTNYIVDIAKINKLDRYNAIIKVLDEHDIKYSIQCFKSRGFDGKNIIVRTYKDNSPKVVISAHYDNAPMTPGANDNAAACSVLLNLIIKYKGTNKNLEFVFTDLEEYGCLGISHYLSKNRELIEYTINLDMVGLGEHIVVSNHEVYYAKHNGVVEVTCLPPGDAYVFIRESIPNLYVVNSTKHDLDFYLSYRMGQMDCRGTDFIKTMHTPEDTSDKINLDIVDKTLTFIGDVIDSL